MKSSILSLTIAGSAALLAAPAPAQANVSVAAAYEAGRCLVSRDRRAAVALIRSLPLDSTPANLSALGDRAAGCISGSMPALLLRGAIAQELFLRDFRSFGREPRDPERLVNLNLPVEEFGARGSGATQLYRWSDCVVRNDTANTERLLRSPVGSAAEASALEALQTICRPASPRARSSASAPRRCAACSRRAPITACTVTGPASSTLHGATMAFSLKSSFRNAILVLCSAVLAASAAGQSTPQADDHGGNRRQRQKAQQPQQAAQAVGLADLYRGVACQAAADPASLEPILLTAPFRRRSGTRPDASCASFRPPCAAAVA